LAGIEDRVVFGEWEGVQFLAGVHGSGFARWSGSRRYTAVKSSKFITQFPANKSDVGFGKNCWGGSF
jgi:hypothetical protein